MTASMVSAGVGAAPASAALELLGNAPASAPGQAAGSSQGAALDPALAPFAGVLARLVGLQSTSDATAARTRDTMMQDALASLEAAINEGASVESAGTAAIKALIEQVTRQSSGIVATAASTSAEAATALVGQALPVSESARALGAAAMIAPPAPPVGTHSAATTRARQTPAAADSSDDDTAAARADAERDGSAATASQGNASAAAASALADPSVVVRDTAILDPVFRGKLDRLVERMQSEFGYSVTVVETVRSQLRQDALFDQGRTAAGQVVTWTRNSRHADGFAADVMIDGGYDNPIAFERLQRLANEEGLHTLGSRDPGHLELRTPQVGGFIAKGASDATSPLALHLPKSATLASAAANQPAADAAMARIARVARIAELAVAADSARVATVARLAMPGVSSGARTVATSAEAPAPSAKVARGTDTTAELPAVAVQGNSAASKSTTRERTTDDGARATQRPADAGAASGESPTAPFIAPARVTTLASAVQAVAGPDQATRVDRIDALHAQSAAQPVSSMVLNVDDGNGNTDRIRVNVRGSTVASTIDVRDQQAASQLSARSDELARALEARGLESESVRIRAVAPPASADTLRAMPGGDAAASRGLAAALASDGSAPSRRERDEARDPRAGWTAQEQHSHRQRSRREREETQP